MQGSEQALTKCNIGEEGCLSVDGHMALALDVRLWFDHNENTLRNDHRISQER